MPPTIASLVSRSTLLPQTAVNIINSTNTNIGAYEEKKWSSVNVASVDLIAMVVSDAGLANTEPQWWNASPTGCMLLGMQPRGGWQVLQRAVQWGNDHWARCFGVCCKVPVLYAYFACTIRNRIEVWNSQDFDSPTQSQSVAAREPEKPSVQDLDVQFNAEGALSTSADTNSTIPRSTLTVAEKSSARTRSASPSIEAKKGRDTASRRPSASSQRKLIQKLEKSQDTSWSRIDRGKAGMFQVLRPTKLIDGSRGGQAFICDILRPEPGKTYGVEEQARLQLLSVLLVGAGLTKTNDYADFLRIAREDFGLNPCLGSIFKRLMASLLVSNFVVLGFAVSLCYGIWIHNLFGDSIPYLIQVCSLMSWASGAIGLSH